ncbi:hypothetical protein YIM_32120 [Amycolatopsis sp. YIM 10]|nr:hypothetical protein YIM_32120 [Amycolatopsis sp. YIM 10]
MSRLLTFNLTVPGQWRDLWLYKEKMYLWDRTGTIYYAKLDDIVKFTAKHYSLGKSLLLQTLSFRYDWKAGEQSRLMMRLPDMESVFLRPFGEEGSVSIEYPRELLRKGTSEAYDGAVLDTSIYANRLYLGTIDGLLESYIHPKFGERAYKLDRQLEHRVTCLTVGYAAINASAEEEGLHFSKIAFSQDRFESPGFKQANFRQIADVSYSASHAGRDLLNYESGATPTFLRAKVEKHSGDALQYENTTVVGYEDQHSRLTLADFINASRIKYPGTPDDARVLGNSGSEIIISINGHIRVVSLKSSVGKEVSIDPNQRFKNLDSADIAADDVLETHPIQGGFLIELPEQVRLITRNGSHAFSDGESARIRTFRSSHRHKQTVAIIQDESAKIVGYYEKDDSIFDGGRQA